MYGSPRKLYEVSRFKREKFVTLKGKDILGKVVVIRLDFEEVLKLAAILLAMLFGNLIQWTFDGVVEHEEFKGDS